MILAIVLLIGAAYVFHWLSEFALDWARAILGQSQSKWYYRWLVLKYLSILTAFVIACVLIWRYLP